MKRECFSTFSSDRCGRRRCKFTTNCESPEISISGPKSTQNTELGPNSGPKSEKSANFWSEIRLSARNHKISQTRRIRSDGAPEFPENGTQTIGLDTENSNSDPKSRKLTEFGPKIAFRIPNHPKSDNEGNSDAKTQFRCPNQSQNWPQYWRKLRRTSTERLERPPAGGFAISPNSEA